MLTIKYGNFDQLDYIRNRLIGRGFSRKRVNPFA